MKINKMATAYNRKLNLTPSVVKGMNMIPMGLATYAI